MNRPSWSRAVQAGYLYCVDWRARSPGQRQLSTSAPGCDELFGASRHRPHSQFDGGLETRRNRRTKCLATRQKIECSPVGKEQSMTAASGRRTRKASRAPSQFPSFRNSQSRDSGNSPRRKQVGKDQPDVDAHVIVTPGRPDPVGPTGLRPSNRMRREQCLAPTKVRTN